jgi:hypothetical protein
VPSNIDLYYVPITVIVYLKLFSNCQFPTFVVVTEIFVPYKYRIKPNIILSDKAAGGSALQPRLLDT